MKYLTQMFEDNFASEFMLTDKTGQEILTALKHIAEKTEGTAFSNAGFHNSIFRGANLGTAVTDSQWKAIQAGTFDDLYVGDYWTISGVVYRIAGFDLFLHTGDQEMTKHHAVILPDKNMYSAQMNTENTTAGGYYNSAMKQSNLNKALDTFKAAFGEAHILKRRALLDNAISGNDPSGWAWYDSYIDLMTEAQLYGQYNWGQRTRNGYSSGIDYSRFPLFNLAPEYVTNRGWYWLRTIYSSADFCICSSAGTALSGSASPSSGVRPFSLIG